MTPHEKVRAALAYIPAYDREIWLRMGMAVKSELGENGFEIWNEWSQSDESHRAADARSVWRSIEPTGKVTIRTLFYEAKHRGYGVNGTQRPSELSPNELVGRQRKNRAAEERRAKQRASGATLALQTWNAAEPAQADHPYLRRKQVPPVAMLRELGASELERLIGYHPKSSGKSLSGRVLIVPIRVGDILSSLEFIDEAARKSALAGAPKAAGFWSAQRMPESDGEELTLLIGEGVATAISAMVATGHPTFAALTCWNLVKVAHALRARYPKAQIILLAELGRGKRQAYEAARAVSGLVAMPAFCADCPEGATDFNDLHQHCGAEGVSRAIASACPPEGLGAPVASVGAAFESGLRVLTLAELVNYEFPEREAILGPWLLTQSLSMIHSWRGIGKTHVALGIAYAVATGGKFLTWEAGRARRVVYVDGEMPGAALKARVVGLIEADDRDFDPTYLRIVTPDAQDGAMPDLATAEGQAAIEAAAADAELIILDNISTLCRSTGPENDAESWRGPQEWALKMRRAGKAVLFIHHSGKGGAQRGSSKREDTLDVVINLKRPPDYSEEQGARFELRYEKYRNGAGAETKPIEALLTTDADGRVSWTWCSVEESTFDRVVGLKKDGLKPTEIAKELGIHKSRVSRHLKRARELGLVIIKGGRENGSE